MTLSIINNQISSNIAFSGKTKQSKNGIPYDHSNAGLITGGIMAIPTIMIWGNTSKGISQEYMDALKKLKVDNKTLAKIQEQAAHQKKYALPFGIIATACTIGCGTLIDHLRNKKVQKAEEELNNYELDQAMSMNNIDFTDMGTPYLKSKEGLKWGALLGAGCGLTHGLMLNKKLNIGTAFIFALGGLILGAITDACHNKSAKKSSLERSYSQYA